jgi:hypothetical protein
VHVSRNATARGQPLKLLTRTTKWRSLIPIRSACIFLKRRVSGRRNRNTVPVVMKDQYKIMSRFPRNQKAEKIEFFFYFENALGGQVTLGICIRYNG